MKKVIMIIVTVFTISLIQFGSYKASLYNMQGVIHGDTVTLENGHIHAIKGMYKDGQAVMVILRNVGNDENLENDTIQKIVVDKY